MKRIISRIDVKNDWIVKGIHLEGLRAIGHPKEYSKAYYEGGIDEIFVMDVVASLYQRNSILGLVEQIASDVFVPITVGGGIRTLEDVSTALSSGADKVAINTAAHNDPNFIVHVANDFGSSTIVACIEAIKETDDIYYCFTDNGREHTGKEVVHWAQELEEKGAGEILVTSVDKEGTGKGFDLDLIRKITSTVNIPVIAHGGAGNVDHIAEAMAEDIDISALCIASILHYHLAKDIGYTQPVNSSRNSINLGRKNIDDISIRALKTELSTRGIPIRNAFNEGSLIV